tara:strand:+ start:117 stop:518 length:402 start_codon:yes stop_codon:yes gene_type:complete
MNIKCISCGKELEEDRHSEKENAHFFPAVWGGVVFRSTGQFGSRVKDCIPCGGGINEPEEIQIIVCDQCLLEKSKQVDCIVNYKEVKTAEYADFDKCYTEEEQASMVERLKSDKMWKDPGREAVKEMRAKSVI